ncbi:MAG: hypothetical protein QY317_16155 [Candidatus Jettenia caeni]|nr:MAG: hypothetical protein QY317_16155 [Candidatus Jettenia caeni]
MEKSNDKEFTTIVICVRKDQLHKLVLMKKKTGKSISKIIQELCDYGTGSINSQHG